MSVVTIGLDLAKTVFQVHDVDEAGVAVLRRKLAHAEMMSVFTKQHVSSENSMYIITYGRSRSQKSIHQCHRCHQW